MRQGLGYFARYDWILLGTSVMLVAFGLMALYSTSLGSGAASVGGDAALAGASFGNFWKQVVFGCVGLAIALLAPVVNYRQLHGMARFLYWFAATLLVAVLLFGRTVRGTTGWFGIGGFGIQPVEIVKILLVIFLAWYFARTAREASDTRRILGSGASAGLLAGLVILQPDLGSALLLLAIWGGLLLLAGVKRSKLIAMLALAIVIGTVAWIFVLRPYQKDRITTFWDPDADPLGRGYNVTQSIIAIGSGGFAGRGLGFGSQSQLRFLPERQTDFIFAVIAEELGFLGVLLLLALFGTFFYRCYVLARGATDDFTMFLVLGIMVAIAVEMFVNIGGNLRLLPVTGVTLPFLSYGGSSLLSKFVMVGLLESVAVRR